ncbi:hypothetical protein N9M41_03795 [Rhodopirellula sp.]|nr:hypothetical protein [Rhodopirellula sp.]
MSREKKFKNRKVIASYRFSLIATWVTTMQVGQFVERYRILIKGHTLFPIKLGASNGLLSARMVFKREVDRSLQVFGSFVPLGRDFLWMILTNLGTEFPSTLHYCAERRNGCQMQQGLFRFIGHECSGSTPRENQTDLSSASE